jgi:hypothetical protein
MVIDRHAFLVQGNAGSACSCQLRRHIPLLLVPIPTPDECPHRTR